RQKVGQRLLSYCPPLGIAQRLGERSDRADIIELGEGSRGVSGRPGYRYRAYPDERIAHPEDNHQPVAVDMRRKKDSHQYGYEDKPTEENAVLDTLGLL